MATALQASSLKRLKLVLLQAIWGGGFQGSWAPIHRRDEPLPILHFPLVQDLPSTNHSPNWQNTACLDSFNAGIILIPIFFIMGPLTRSSGLFLDKHSRLGGDFLCSFV